LDGGNDALLHFAADLRVLRERAGSPPYRELARRAFYSAGTLSDAAGGRKLPSLPVTLGYIRACGGNEAEWRARWQELAVATAPQADDGDSPYVGLAAFQPEDSERFFGRERLVLDVLDRLAEHRLLAVFGVSGAGKSSLLRAGVLPRARATGMPTVLLSPGTSPLRELAAHLAALTGGDQDTVARELADDPAAILGVVEAAIADHPSEIDLLIVVDQFEEVFTLCSDAGEGTAFVDALLSAADPDGGRCRIVLGVRADFYHRCAANARLARALATAQVVVGPMTGEELSQAITKPAVAAGCTVEGALLAKIVADAGGQPGMLPLVSHALLEAWRRRRGNALTVAGYEAAGGIHGAVAQTAERAYTALAPEHRRRARQLLLRLVTVGDGTEDTKRRVRRDEPNDDVVVLDALAHARLVTLDRDTVEIAHEALIRCWPRLRDWLDEDRDSIRLHRQLAEATAGWESVHHDPGALYRGVRLAVAAEWAELHPDGLTARERSFLDTSTRTEQRDQALRSRRNRQLQVLTVALSMLLVVAAVVTVVAVRQRQDAVRDGQIATSRQLAAEANTVAGSDVAAAMRMSLQAYGSYPTEEARSAVLSLASRHDYDAVLPAPFDVAAEQAFRPGTGELAAPGQPGHIDLWDVQRRARVADLSGRFGQVLTVAFDRDGGHLVAGTEDGRILIWDLAGPSVIAAAMTDGPVRKVRFSPDGMMVASDGDTGTRLWSAAHLTPLVTLTHRSEPGDLAFTPAGVLAFVDDANRLSLWDPRTSSVVGTIDTPLRSLAVSPDGRTIATAGSGKAVRLWDLATRTHIADLDHVDGVLRVVFDPTGDRLVSVDVGGYLFLWDVRSHARITQLNRNKNNRIVNAAFSSDGRFLAGSSVSGNTLLWDRTRLPLLGHIDTVSVVAFNPRDDTMASSSPDGALILWDRRTRTPLVTVPGAGTSPLDTRGPVFSPDGRWIVTSYQQEVVLRNAATLAVTATIVPRAEGHTVTREVFSPDSRTLAMIVDGHVIRFYDIATRRQHDRDLAGDTAQDISYSPDGGRLAVGTVGGKVLLWDTEGGGHRELTIDHGQVGTVAFSPDGRRLAAAALWEGSGKVTIWDPATGRRTGELTDPTAQFEFIAFSPNSRLLATLGDNDTVAVWDTATNSRWATLFGHTATVTDVAWSPDGRALASGARDQTITLWTIDTATAIRDLCESLTKDFPGTGPRPGVCGG
jgi:WD40 repeat protein